MDYQKIYNKLIERAKGRENCGYTERHHIIPRCIGGNDELENLVRLTPEEHYTAHLLLSRIYPNEIKLIMASMMMCANRKNNKVYGWLRKRHAEVMSISQLGENNSIYGSRWVTSIKTRESILLKKNEPIPDGWILGRKIFNLPTCEYCKKEFIRQKYERFCSKDCRMNFKTSTMRIIDENIDRIISIFIENKSISKTLSYLNFNGRMGNKYLSNILKKRGYGNLIRHSR